MVPVPDEGLYPHVIKKGCSGIPHDRSSPLSRLSGCIPAEPGSKPDCAASGIPQSRSSLPTIRLQTLDRALARDPLKLPRSDIQRRSWAVLTARTGPTPSGWERERGGSVARGRGRVQTVVTWVAANSRRKDNVAGRAMPTSLAPSWWRPCPDPRTNAL